MKDHTDFLLFSKSPSCSEAKTRLRGTQHLSDSEVQQLHSNLVYSCLDILGTIPNSSIYASWYDTSQADIPSQYMAKICQEFKQQGDSFGSRLTHSINMVEISSATSGLLIVGSDCPALSRSNLEEASKLLANGKAVLGPSRDLGAYLIGIPCHLRSDIDLSDCFETEEVFENLKAKLLELDRSLKIAQLEVLEDLDTIEDLEFYRQKHPKIYDLLMLPSPPGTAELQLR